MRWFRRPAIPSLAAVLAAGGTALAPVAGQALALPSPSVQAASPSTCPVIATGAAGSFGQLTDVQGAASITCWMPGGSAYGSPPRAADPPPDGGPCMDTVYEPLFFVDRVNGNQTYSTPRGYYDRPDGKSWDDLGKVGVGGQGPTYGAWDAGVTDYWAVYERPGKVVNGRC